MRLSNIAHLYVVRLRARSVLVQECFAVAGIAIGVALLFASQVASASLNGSVRELTQEMVGRMQLQLDARSPQGFSESLVVKARRLPGVLAVLPLLETRANIVGRTGQQSVDLIGLTPRFVGDASPLLQHFRHVRLTNQSALALPKPLLDAVGVEDLETVQVQTVGHSAEALVGAELTGAQIGALVHSPVAIAQLRYAQRLAGASGRITRLFVQTEPRALASVRAGLTKLAAGRINVQPSDFDATLFEIAAAPANQGEGLFSGISALVGFIFAINAMLLGVGRRSGLVRELRAHGWTRTAAAGTLLFDAAVLGTMSAILGLILGDLLSVSLFRSNPGYLSFAFPVGTQRIITWQSVALATGAGLLATCAGVLLPLSEAFTTSRTSVRAARRLRARLTILGIFTAAICMLSTTLILLLVPQSAVLGCVTLVIALLLLLPLLLNQIIALFDRAQRRFGHSATQIAVVELRSPSTRARSIAIAATGAVAVFGSVSIQGAQSNLQHGLNGLFHGVSSVAAIWVVPPGDQNLLATAPFQGDDAGALTRAKGVQALSSYRAGFLDWRNRRLWVLAPPQNVEEPIPPSQVTVGDTSLATRRVKAGGWAAISQALANEKHLHIGQSFTLPAPVPLTLRVAALLTNLGWPPGAVILNSEDYRHGWNSANPTAYTIKLAPGASPQQVGHELQSILGPHAALVVQTAARREALQRAASRQGLSRLTQIATLVLITTILAISIAMATMVWQRRQRLARMKVQGYTTRILWRALLWETAVLLGAGCSIGAVFGIYGQLLISHALATVTGFPVLFSTGILDALASFALVSAVAVAIVALPGYRAASVPPYA